MWRKNKPAFLTPVMNLRQKVVFTFLRLVWFTALLYFWGWWVREGHVTTVIGFVITSIVIFWETVSPLYYLILSGRMKKANPEIEPPEGRVLLVICETPGEPWAPVGLPTARALLETARVYTARTGNKADVALFHENPSSDRQIASDCRRLGIKIYTRHGKPQYHNAEFPFRTKSKEGNLNGNIVENNLLRKYEFIATFDCDHVPQPDYLVNAMRYFADPKVGLVSAPSICDANLDMSWVVKARSDAECGLHGAQQAGSSAPLASLAIGSHYLARSEALEGNVHPIRKDGKTEYVRVPFGPELAEDHSTTLSLNARGWRSVHAIDAIAHGDGATSFADSMTQEFQWSRSLMVVLLKWTPGYYKIAQMGLIKKAQFLFAQIWYPIFALTLLIGHLMAPTALALKLPWVNVDYSEFLIHWIPLTVACIIPGMWMRRQGFMRPTDGSILSWESFLFTLVRWPWALYGVVQGAISVLILRRELSFKVTPKGVTGPQPLPIKALIPYLFIIVVTMGTALAVGDAGPSRGYYWFALLDAFIYMIVTAAIIVLHVKENRSRLTRPAVFFVWKPLAILMIATILFAAGVIVRGKDAMFGITGNPSFIGGSWKEVPIGYAPNGKRIMHKVLVTPEPAKETTNTSAQVIGKSE